MGRPPTGRNVDSRTRLLNSLGLFQQQQREQQQRDESRHLGTASVSRIEGRDGSPPSNDATNSDGKKKIRHLRSHSDIPTRSALHNTVAFQTKLNDESVVISPQETRSIMKRRSSLSDKDKSDNIGSVRFNTVVSGVKIPSRDQYSRRIKQTLWRDRYELSEMVERNTTEFHAENYDWHQVVLDDQMYVDATSGERVHPCHVEGSFDDSQEIEDDDEDDDAFGDGPGFAPLSRSDSILNDKSTP
jgi:hypothetical protein